MRDASCSSARHVPVVGVHVLADEPLGHAVEHVFRQRHHVGARVHQSSSSQVDLALEDLAAQRVDALALLVHHVVVLEQVLADGEVLRLDLLLRPLDGAAHHPVLDRHALFHAQPLHQAGDAVRPEDAHQVVFEGQVEARRAGVALAAGAAAQLVVDAPGLVALGAEDVQPAQRDHLVVLGVGLLL